MGSLFKYWLPAVAVVAACVFVKSGYAVNTPETPAPQPQPTPEPTTQE